MTCEVPKFLSDLRQVFELLFRSEVLVVPDQQEVFVSDCGKLSVIIEILEHPDVPDQEAAGYFFNDLSRENSALSAKVLESKVLSPAGQAPLNHTVALLKGEFDVKKAKPTPDHVIVRLAVIRIPDHRADILITMHETTSQGSGTDRQEEPAPGNLDDVAQESDESKFDRRDDLRAQFEPDELLQNKPRGTEQVLCAPSPVARDSWIDGEHMVFDVEKFAKEAGQPEEQAVSQAALDISKRAGRVASRIESSEALTKLPSLHKEAENELAARSEGAAPEETEAEEEENEDTEQEASDEEE
ncbi:hypothetical protein Emag_004873 [Eimeria magna]